ncbi:hypothetical protein RKD23_002947 [Streptomyces sp. SAI-170]|uniref:hypothetical protein n=1 Tax=Streptomyces sp. SAI-170 TaxID=3377729 RepID=UPI003C7A253A
MGMRVWMRMRLLKLVGEGCCRSWARRLAGSASAAALALGLLLWGAPAATAGGLTSVLVVSPESRETASLYYSDSAYRRLERLLGEPGEGTAARPPEADLVRTRQISVTWLAHDISPVRVDRVHLASDGPEVWIHTSTTPPEWTGTWQRAAQPSALRSLLDELGVMGRAADPETAAGPPPAPAAPAETGPQDDASQPVTASAPLSDDSGWWWALPGLGVGVAVGCGGALLIRRAAARQEPGPPRGEPRQELIDL